MFDGLDANERANKAALLLAHERYAEQLASFVKNRTARLALVEDQIAKILEDVASETGADLDYIKDRFAAFLRESVPSAIPENSLGIRNDTPADLNEFIKTDVLDRGEVPGAGTEEALNDGVEKQDLGDYTLPEDQLAPEGFDSVAGKCARCGNDIEEKLASKSAVCAKCTFELHDLAKQADQEFGEGTFAGQPSTGVATSPDNMLAQPTDPNNQPQYTCTICGQQGTQQDVLNHVNNDHADVLQRMQTEQATQGQVPSQPQQYPMAASTKEGDVTDGDNPAKVEPLQETPGSHFDDIVNDLAQRAAARHFSLPTEEDIQSISSQLGLTPDEVRNNLFAVASFGNYVGMNGELGGDGQPPAGYEPIQAQLAGNDQHQALVPTDLVVSKVAEDMNMDNDLAYSMIRDRFGADLPTEYHAQVKGQQVFYLPSQMAGNQQLQQQEQQATDPNVGPAFQQTPPGAPVQQPGTVPQQ